MDLLLLNVVVLIVALLHLWFLTLEMFLWTRPLGLKIFHLTPEFAQKSKGLAKNQGLYNGFLVAGLLWSLFAAEPFASKLKLFFLSCVLIAGIYGALTVNKRIFWFQGLPALFGLIILGSLYVSNFAL